MKLPCYRTWLKRVRATAKQGMLSNEQRQNNVLDAFAVSKRAKLQDKHVLLVDDIITSGSTAHEMAKVLKRAGARMVDVAVVARGVGSGSPGKA
jgi:predicted amidophosphoribosyltransferase